MNIRQAKTRFTELTGLPATKIGSTLAICRYSSHYVIEYISSNTPLELYKNCHDRRTTRYWILLVQAIESYMEAA